MLTIKWTRPNGATSIRETKAVCILVPGTDAWDEYKRESPAMIDNDTRGIVMHDGGTICVLAFSPHLCIINENGKTVQTV